MDMGNRITGVIFDIKKYALHDGPGIRTTIFLKGCPLSCWWCHNPESQNLGIDTLPNETIGCEMTVEEVMGEIEKDLLFYDESGGGVTFSGGEPLIQPRFLYYLLSACKEREILTALDTSGYASWEIINRIKTRVDLFLYDIKLLDDEKHQAYTGVSNKQILSNFERLDKEKFPLIIRFPVIPGITDTSTELDLLVKWIEGLQTCQEINLLPYHKIGKGKYERLGWTYRLNNLEPPSNERLEELMAIFQDLGLNTKIGG
jgi:pyruvate formate lyase activating enzyme